MPLVGCYMISNSSFDSSGDDMCLPVRADSYDTITNIKPEALALLHGLQLCIDSGCLYVDIEVDSLIIYGADKLTSLVARTY